MRKTITSLIILMIYGLGITGCHNERPGEDYPDVPQKNELLITNNTTK